MVKIRYEQNRRVFIKNVNAALYERKRIIKNGFERMHKKPSVSDLIDMEFTRKPEPPKR
jgi:hypothetical protein